MAKIPDFKRIDRDGSSKEADDIFDKIGYNLNTFGDDVVRGFTKGIGFDNLNQSIMSFQVELDINGIPKDEILIRISVIGIQGFNVIQVINLTDDTFPTNQPFISYTLISNGSVRIDHITGLTANKIYQLKAIAYGL